MCKAPLVHVIDSAKHLLEEELALNLTESALFYHVVEELTPFNQLLCNESNLFGCLVCQTEGGALAEILIPNDIFVIQMDSYVQLLMKQLESQFWVSEIKYLQSMLGTIRGGSYLDFGGVT